MYKPATPLLGIYPKTNIHSKRQKEPHVHCTIIYNSQDTETI